MTLSETNTMKPEAMLALRREISTEIGLDFSQDQKRLLESWQNLNNDGFDLFSKMCDNLSQLNDIEVQIPDFEALLSKPSNFTISES